MILSHKKETFFEWFTFCLITNMKDEWIDTDCSVSVTRCFIQINTCYLHAPVKHFVRRLSNLHPLGQRTTSYLTSVMGSKWCIKVKFRIKLVSPYLTRTVLQEDTCFTPTFDEVVRTVQQKHVAEGRTGPKSCLPSVAFRVCHLSGVYFHKAVNSEYFYNLEWIVLILILDD